MTPPLRLLQTQTPAREAVSRTLAELNSTETTQQTIESGEDEATPDEMADTSIPSELHPRRSRRLSERGPAPSIPLSSAPRRPVVIGTSSSNLEANSFKDGKSSQNATTGVTHHRTKTESSRNKRRGPNISSHALADHRRYREMLKKHRNNASSLYPTHSSVWANEDGSVDNDITRTAGRLMQARWEAMGGLKRVPVDEDGVPLIAGPGIEIDYDEDGKPLVVQKVTKAVKKNSILGG